MGEIIGPKGLIGCKVEKTGKAQKKREEVKGKEKEDVGVTYEQPRSEDDNKKKNKQNQRRL